jgi:hypothetical protein
MGNQSVVQKFCDFNSSQEMGQAVSKVQQRKSIFFSRRNTIEQKGVPGHTQTNVGEFDF